jgi:hypothetical protein
MLVAGSRGARMSLKVARLHSCFGDVATVLESRCREAIQWGDMVIGPWTAAGGSREVVSMSMFEMRRRRTSPGRLAGIS